MNRRALILLVSLVSILAVFAVYFGLLGKKNQNITVQIQAATGSKTITSQAEWEVGTRDNIDSTSTPGAVKIDTKTETQIDMLSIYNANNSRLIASPHQENAYKAIDGDLFTQWGSDPNVPATPMSWQLDLASTYIIHKGIFYTTTAIYNLSWSLNGTDWTQVCNNVGQPAGETCTFTDVNTKYVKITSGGSEVGDGVKEFELYSNATGTHTSAASQLDAGAHTTMNWTTFVPSGTIPANTSINFRFRTSADASNWSNWSNTTPYAASIDLAAALGDTDKTKRYLQVETTLANTDGASTPTLDAYTANYNYAVLDHVTVTPATATVTAGGTQAFTASAIDDDGDPIAGATFSYSASGGSIDGSGNYTAPATAGSYTVTVSSTIDGTTKTTTATVTVTSTPPITPPSDGCATVSYIKIAPTPEIIKINQGETFTAFAYDSSDNLLPDADFSWQKSAGTLNSSGLHNQIASYISPAATGNNWVRAIVCDKSKTVNFAVLNNIPTAITISASPDEVALKPGDKQQYQAKVLDQDDNDITSGCPVSWSMRIPSAGSISSSGLLSSTSNLGFWSDAVKAEVSCFGQTDFALLSFTTSNEERYLDFVSMSFPLLTAVKGSIDTLNFSADAFDQFGFRLPAATYAWQLLDNQIGTFSANGRYIKIETSSNYGCYLYKVEATATYGGKSLSGYSSVAIYPADYKLAKTGESCPEDSEDLGSKVLTRLLGAKRALAADPPVLSKIHFFGKIYLRPGQAVHLTANQRNQYGSPINAKVEFFLRDQAAGKLSSGNSTFIAGETTGSFSDAIEVKVSSGDKVLTSSATVVVTNEQRKAVSYNAGSGTLKIAPKSSLWLYVGLKDQFGSVSQVTPAVILEDASGENLFSSQNHNVIKTGKTEGKWQKAIKLTIDLDKINQRIPREEDKYAKPAPITYLNLDINKNHDNPKNCLKDGPPCDPEITDCSLDGSSGGKIGGIGGLIGNLIDGIKNNLLASIAAAAALILSLLTLLLSLLANPLSLIGPGELWSWLVKGRDKKHRPGIVYDSASGLPLPAAKILLFRARDNKLINLAESNRGGRFALETPGGEEYYIEIQKEGFSQLSQQQSILLRAGLAYDSNYFGGNFRPKENETLFTGSIPLATTAENVAFAKRARTLENISKVLRTLNIPILLFGFSMSIYVLTQSKNIFNYSIFAVYIIIFIYLIYRLLSTSRMYGTVFNSATQTGVDLAVVRAFSEANNKLTKTSVSNLKGRYTLALPKGFYKLLVSKPSLEQASPLAIRVKSSLNPRKEKIGMREIERVESSQLPVTSSQLPVTSSQLPDGKKLDTRNRTFDDAKEIIENFKKKPETESYPHPNWKF